MKLIESGFQFRDPEITCVEFYINEDFDNEKFKDFTGLNASLKKWKNRDGNNAYVEMTIDMGERSSMFPFKIKVAMKSEFIWPETLGEDEISAYLKINAPSLLMAYIRPVIAQITGGSKYPALNLPFIDFTQVNVEY